MMATVIHRGSAEMRGRIQCKTACRSAGLRVSARPAAQATAGEWFSNTVIGHFFRLCLERLYDNQNNNGEQNKGGELVEPAIPHVAVIYLVTRQFPDDSSAPEMIQGQ